MAAPAPPAAAVVGALDRWGAGGHGPVAPADPAALARAVEAVELCPEEGLGFEAALDGLGPAVLAPALRPHHPWAAAHLHSPPLLAAAAAELAVGLTNQSLDSFDQAPAATFVEDRLVAWLAGLAGLPPGATGTLTAGGTASNLLGLFAARHHAAAARGLDVGAGGVPPEAARWRVLVSEAAHFSVAQALDVLGLGRAAAHPVPTDGQGRMGAAAAERAVADLARAGLEPIAVVATAGTTDLGAVDDLAGLADLAGAHGLWLHVDAAVASGFLLSPALAPALAGLGRAHSVTADLHKLWWQPISASALLVRSPGLLAPARFPTPYLSRPGDEVLNLVDRSLDTSRRFDALKVVVSLRAVGRRRLAGLVERVVALARAAGELVGAHPHLVLAAPPQTVTCVFRWHPPGVAQAQADAVNVAVQRHLLRTGEAVVGRTTVGGAPWLKLTVVDPRTTEDDLAGLLGRIGSLAGALAGRS